MIFANIKHKERYNFLNEKFKKCFDFIKNTDLKNLKAQKYEIDGNDIFVNIVEYNTKTKSEGFWEAHKSYIDMHYMITGCEKISCCFKEVFENEKYKENEDFISFNSKKFVDIDLFETDFLICYPEDGHMTALNVNNSSYAKKAIFKIKI